MGGATIWPVPKAVDLEAYHYPRHWKRNMFFLYSGLFLIGFQISRFALVCKVSIYTKFSGVFGFIFPIILLLINAFCFNLAIYH